MNIQLLRISRFVSICLFALLLVSCNATPTATPTASTSLETETATVQPAPTETVDLSTPTSAPTTGPSFVRETNELKQITSAAYSPDSRFLFVGHETSLSTLDVDSFTSSIFPIDFTPLVLAPIPHLDSLAVASGSGDIYFFAYDPNTGIIAKSDIPSIHAASQAITALAASPDGNFLAAESYGSLALIDIATGTVRPATEHLPGHAPKLANIPQAGGLNQTTLQFSPDSKYLLYNRTTPELSALYDVATQKAILYAPKILFYGEGGVWGTVFLENSNKSAYFYNDGQLAPLGPIDWRTNFYRPEAISNDAALVAVLDSDQILVFDVESGQPIANLENILQNLHFTIDKHWLVGIQTDLVSDPASISHRPFFLDLTSSNSKDLLAGWKGIQVPRNSGNLNAYSVIAPDEKSLILYSANTLARVMLP